MRERSDFRDLRWRDVIIVVILIPAIAFSLIVISKGLPEKRYIYKISQAVKNGNITSENYYKIPQGFTDNWSNCSSLIQGTRGYPQNLFSSAAEGVYLGECPKLVTLVNSGWTGKGLSTAGFDQYWHGYQIVEKPLVTLFGYSLTCIILLLAYLWLLIKFVKRMTRTLVPRFLFLATIFLTTDFLLLYSSIPQAIWQIAALATPMTLGAVLKNNPDSRKLVLLMNIAAGFLSWYFDFGFALGISLIIWIFYVSNTRSGSNSDVYSVKTLKQQATYAVIWICGTAYAMLSHTLIVGLFRGFHYAFSHIFSRFSDDTALNQKSTIFSGLSNTLKFYTHTEFFFPWVCLILMVALFSKDKKQTRASIISRLRMVISLMCLTIAYLVATSAVSSYHSWLAQRIWGWLLALIIAILARDMSLRKAKFSKEMS